MIIIDVEQGTTAWQMARLGIPTASRFDSIITNKTAKLSESARKYAWELIAEQKLGTPVNDATSGFMQRGSILERKAVSWYELTREVDTEAVGFVLRDDRRVGCSPDRLVGADGLLEIKCPSAAVHVGYALGDEGAAADYRAQCQGQLWLTGRAWVDSLSWNPELEPAVVRVHRDEEYITKLAEAVDGFLAMMDSFKRLLINKGWTFPADETGRAVA